MIYGAGSSSNEILTNANIRCKLLVNRFAHFIKNFIKNSNSAPEQGAFSFPYFDAPPIVSTSCYGCSGGQNLKIERKIKMTNTENTAYIPLSAISEADYFIVEQEEPRID